MKDSTSTRLKVALLFIVAFSSPLQARDVIEYDYVAYSRGIAAGTAEVRVIREGEHYEIHGEAEATGLFKLFSDWRSWFQVSGHASSSLPISIVYEHFESNRSRSKEIKVMDGVTQYVRNGEARAPTEAAALIDVFSLIFVYGQCDKAFRAHSGRMGYDIVRDSREATAFSETCIYSVLDDEGTRFRAMVALDEVNGVRAPVELDFSGYQLGRFRLQDVQTYEE
ncbi:MAG: DUF3108 domain-containing protein [Gammaproteobacteria bacterium]|nr:DUF3108 domain-containing protein [Gammaproteobacteria bacterium]